jgi:ABC-type uncharacterized transport system permease subunit
MILPIDADAFTAFGQYSALAVVALYGLYGFWGSDESPTRARILIWVLWFLHGLSVAHSLIGDVDLTPHFGFAPALSATAWLIFSCYVLERHWFPQSRIRWIVALMGMASVALTYFFPGQALHLGASPLLPVHWALGMASYGLFGAAVIHALVLSHAERMIRQAQPVDEGLPLLTLERLTYRFVTAGFVLLTATLLAGALFGDYLYGPAHAFRLDHKTVFSILSWLIFATLLLGRARLGWRGQKATRVLYLGSGLLFLAYAGSRFVLEVVLHRSF